jgi:biotin carboxylase
MRADSPEELVSRFRRLERILAAERCDEVLIEDYVPGVEVALEGLLDGGQLHVLALFDKPDPLEGPFFEETIYVTPSRLPEDAQERVRHAAGRAAAALGLREGPVHAELRLNADGPWLVEVAGRSIGGLCSRTLRFGVGASLEELILRQALGLGFEPTPHDRSAAGVLMIPIPKPGILRAVEGIEAVRAVPLVEDVEITARLNYPMVPLPEGDSYLGFVFARGERPEAVEQALRAAHALLRFEIVPELGLARS